MLMLFRCVVAEILKTRRTLALWVALASPALVAVLDFFIFFSSQRSQTEDAWDFFPRNAMILWCVGMLPLFITLVTALLAQTEHSEKHWKHLFALPVPRYYFYAAKWLAALLLLGIASLGLYVSILGLGVLLSVLRPQYTFGPLPLMPLAVQTARVFLSSLLLLSVHLYAALRWRSFAFASAFGIVATLVNVVVLNSDVYYKFFPWSYPTSMVFAETAEFAPVALLVSVLGGAALLFLGAWDMTRQDVLA